MSAPRKKPFRKRHLFARDIGDVVKAATQPLMNRQGKIYGALLRDWAQIVGSERASVTRPGRLQFLNRSEAKAAVLHLHARPSAAPELVYVEQQMLEQCARYFGYRAIERIVIHATHEGFNDQEHYALEKRPVAGPAQILPDTIPADMRQVLERISSHLASPSDKKS